MTLILTLIFLPGADKFDKNKIQYGRLMPRSELNPVWTTHAPGVGAALKECRIVCTNVFVARGKKKK
jgi:hypothetical protein